MSRRFWDRLWRGWGARAVEREAEEERMSPAERRFVDESLEDRQADEFVAEHLGGIDPERLVEEGEPPREDEPPGS